MNCIVKIMMLLLYFFAVFQVVVLQNNNLIIIITAKINSLPYLLARLHLHHHHNLCVSGDMIMHTGS